MITDINFKPGDIIKVHQKIREGDKTRIQIFRGVVLGMRGRGINKMFTVMKKVGNISIQRIWPVNSPNVEKVELAELSKKKIRRAKLNYLKTPKHHFA
jgi:large subunit ribosomal protein L19